MDEQLLSRLQRIEGILATLLKVEIAPLLREALQDPVDQKLFEMTGSATSREIRKALKIGQNRISET